jgi:hypothetical protein
MSLDDSTPPATERTPGSDASSRRAGLPASPAVLGGLALVLVLGLVAFFALRGGADDADASDCVRETVNLTTAPAMEDLVAQAVKAVEKDEPCIDVAVTAGTVKDVVAIMNDPNGTMPNLWIPDSPTWKGQLSAAGWAGTNVADVIAQTPVGLVSGPAADAPGSWADALAGGRLAMADPSADGASALALLAPYAEMKQTRRTPEQIKEATVPVAQTFGERAVSGEDNSTDLSAVSATSTQLVPVTEQAFLAARRGNDQLTMVAPRTGVPMLQFPIVEVTRGSIDVLGSGRNVSGRVGRALAHWFASGAGQQAVADAEFRTADASELSGGVGLGASRVLPTVAQKTTDETLRNWRVTSVPSSILAVVDLSGSMKTAIGNVSRIQLAATASKVALDALPAHARVGLWGFSKNRGEDGQSWQEYAPLIRLDADAGDGLTQREFLQKDADAMPGRVRGATGVMDTVLAAYKAAQKDWDPAYFNSVVVMTDGASDYTSSLSIDGLVKQLTNLRDPSKPVKVIIIGISQDADSPELAQIAGATGGQNYLVTDPDDILGVLASALLNR